MREYLIIFCLYCTPLLSQETINVKFSEADPLWVHTMVDTTFVPVTGQAYFTKYSSLSPHILQRDGNYLYSMAVCNEKQTLDDYGFVLDKIDIRTGQKLWSHHNTPYNQGQKDIYQNLSVSGDKIEMVGAEEGIDKEYYASYKNLDINTGKLVKYSKAFNMLPGFYTRYFTGFVLSSDSLLLNAYTEGDDVGTIDNPKYVYGMTTELYDKNMLNLKKESNLFNFDTLGPFSIDQPNYTLRLNKNTLISLAYKDRYESWDNLGTKIMWTDISDPLNIKTKQINDYTDLIPGTKESFALQRFKAINNTIHVSHYYPNFDIMKNTCYILWLDSIGEVKTFIPIPKYKEHIYQFADMIYANDVFAYLFVFPSVTKKQGFDIVRIENGVDTIKFISSLTVQTEGEEFGTQLNALFEDGYLIFGGLAKKTTQGTKTSTKFWCFKASDLGINFEPVSTIDNQEIENPEVTLFPNPTTGLTFIKCDKCGTKYSVNLLDQFGNKLISNIFSNQYVQLNLVNLANGIYFTEVVTEKGLKLKVNKIVKLE